MAKRVFDLGVSLIALAMLSPVLFAVWCWVKIDSPGPGLFLQPRVGQGGRVFQILKFRTMHYSPTLPGDYRTKPGDPRITQAGRFLRRLSLDELPQLINVIKGEMSIVGPRPDTPMQESRYLPEQWQERLSVRPGITGLAQATKRSDANHDERLAMDLDYIARRSIFLDLKICLMTLGKLTGQGSN